MPYRSNTKSLVWYRPAVFTDNGWAVLQTLVDLDRVVKRKGFVENEL